MKAYLARYIRNRVILSILFVFALLIGLVFSHTGNRLILIPVNYFSPDLTVELHKGRLLDEATVSIHYQSESLSISLNKLGFELGFYSCKGLCFNTTSLEHLTIFQKQAVTEFQKQSATKQNNTYHVAEKNPIALVSEKSFFSLPVPIVLTNLLVNNFEYRTYEDSIDKKCQSQCVITRGEGFEIAGTLADEHILLQSVNIESLFIALNDTESHRETEANMVPPVISDIYIDIPHVIDIDSFKINKLDMQQGHQEHGLRDVRLTAQFNKNNVEIEQFTGEYKNYLFESHGRAIFSRKNQLALTLKVNTLDTQSELFSLNSEGSLDAMKLKASLYNEVQLNVTGQVNLNHVGYPANLIITSDGFEFNIDSETAQVENLDLTYDGALTQYSVKGHAQVSYRKMANVRVESEIGGNLNAVQSRLKITSNSSQTDMSARVDWSDALQANFEVTRADITLDEFSESLRGKLLGQGKLSFAAKKSGWGLAVDNFNVTGHVNQVPVNANITLNLDDDWRSHIESFEIMSGANKLVLDGEVSDEWNLAGQLHITEQNELIDGFLGLGDGNITVTGKLKAPKFEWQIQFEELNYLDYRSNQVNFTGVVDTSQNFLTKVVLNSGHLTYANHEFGSVDLVLNGDLKNHTVEFNLLGDDRHYESALSGHYIASKWHGSFSKFNISHQTAALNIREPINIEADLQNQYLNVLPHCWQGKNSDFCVKKLRVAKEAGELELAIEQLNLSLLNLLDISNVQSSGTISGHLNADIQSNGIYTLNSELHGSDMTFTVATDQQDIILPIEEFSLGFVGDKSNIAINSVMNSSILGAIVSDIAINDLKSARTLSGNIKLEGLLLAKLQPFIPNLDRLNGHFAGDMKLDGTLLNPKIHGQIKGEGIEIASKSLPLALRESEFSIQFDENKASFDATLNDELEGHVNTIGELVWSDTNLQGTMVVRGDSFMIMPEPKVWLSIRPELAIEIENNQVEIQGDIIALDGRIRIDELPNEAVALSDDVHIVDVPKRENSTVPLNTILDLNIVVSEKVTINSFGLNSKLAGNLRLSGNTSTPVMAVGEISLVDGEYRAFGQELKIDTGQVGFSGALDKPYLNVRAIRDPELTDDGVIAGVHLTGHVDSPKLEVFSEPAMEQSNALSYVLTGRAPGEGNSSSDAMLTQFLLSKGLARSSGTISRIAEIVGFKDIALTSRGSGDETKVEISGYVAPGVQVRYSVGVFDSLSEVAVRYQILPQLYIEATNGINDALDILYKFDWE